MKTGITKLRRVGRYGTMALGLSAVGLTAVAQTSQPNEARSSRLVLSAGGTIDEDGERFFSSASAEINRETRTQSLQFTASTQLDFGLDDGSPAMTDPRLSLTYRNTGSPLTYVVALNYSESDLDGEIAADPDDETIVASDFVLDTGTRISRSARASLSYGERAPFGVTLNLGINDLRYVDSLDPRLFDRVRTTADLDFRFDVSPVLTVTAGLGYEQTDTQDDDATLSEQNDLTLGFVAQVSKVLTVDGSVSYVETQDTIDDGFGGRVSTTSDDWGYTIGATLDRPNGAMRLSYSRQIESEGEIDRISFNRSLDLTETQALSFSVGTSRLDGDAEDFEADISYTQRFKASQLQLRAQQVSSFSDTDDPVTTRQISGRYSQELSRVSTISADVSYASLDYLNDAFEDTDSLQFGVTYAHALTSSWDLSTRAYYSQTSDDDGEAESYGLTVQINKTFDLFD